jgi:hypothetical protein
VFLQASTRQSMSEKSPTHPGLAAATEASQ